MSWSRLFQCGFEFRDINELATNASYGTASGLISTSEYNTGSASFDMGSGSYSRGKAIAGTSTLTTRSGMYIKTTGTNTGDEGIIFLLTGSTVITVSYDTDDNLLRIRVGGTEVDSIALSATDLATVDTWHNVGVYCYRDSTNGHIGFYINSNLVLEYDGNTGTYTDGVYAGGDLTTNAWHTATYIDDFYCDYSTSLESETVPPNLLFAAIKPNADGSTIDWSTFGSASHYANVDDTTPDSDTTYNYAIAASVVDQYGLENYSVPSGFSIAAVIPTVHIKKTGAGTDPTIDIGLRENSTDAYGSSQALGTTYAYYWDRFTTAPDTDNWDDTNIDNTELIVRSSGTF